MDTECVDKADIIGNKEILSIAYIPCIYGIHIVSWFCRSVNKHFSEESKHPGASIPWN